MLKSTHTHTQTQDKMSNKKLGKCKPEQYWLVNETNFKTKNNKFWLNFTFG